MKLLLAITIISVSSLSFSQDKRIKFSPKFGPGKCVLACQDQQKGFSFSIFSSEEIRSTEFKKVFKAQCLSEQGNNTCSDCQTFCNPRKLGK